MSPTTAPKTSPLPCLPSGVCPIAVAAAAAGCWFGVSARQWRRMHSAGEVPDPIRVGSRPRWRVDDLLEWSRLGCPTKCQYETAKTLQSATPAL